MGGMEDMRDELNRDDYPSDVSNAKSAIETHKEMRKKIVRGPVDEIDQLGVNIMQRCVWETMIDPSFCKNVIHLHVCLNDEKRFSL